MTSKTDKCVRLIESSRKTSPKTENVVNGDTVDANKTSFSPNSEHTTKTKEKLDEEYVMEKTIGQGHYAVVKSARHVFSGERVAIKVIDKTKLDAVSREHLFQEVRCMKLVKHPNVVRLYEVIDTPNKLYLILEYADGGDMYDVIMKHTSGLGEPKAKVYFRQIVKAIKYCHDLRVVHRDIKPENVVYFAHTDQMKLTDFGFSNIFEPGTKLSTACGSLAYSAPELLLGDAYDAPAVDVWSLGVILYMLVVGKPPFNEVNDSETLTKIFDCKYTLPRTITRECADLITKMIVRDPCKRIALTDLLVHKWLVEATSTSAVSQHDTNVVPVSMTTKKCTKTHPFADEQYMKLAPLIKLRSQTISDKDKQEIIECMINGNIAPENDIHKALEEDKYNYITATYYLLAERLLQRKFNRKLKRNMDASIQHKQQMISTFNASTLPAPSSSQKTSPSYTDTSLKNILI